MSSDTDIRKFSFENWKVIARVLKMPRTLIAIGLFATVGCTTDTPTSDGIRVTQTEYGARWPFTVTDGTLRCYTDRTRQFVVFDTGNGIQYGLNGAARGVGGFPDSKAIMKPDTFGVHLQPLIDRGLTLCR